MIPADEEIPAASSPQTAVVAPAAVVRDATFAVGGMTCASCSAIIEKMLGKTAGVPSAVVNLATEKLTVTYDPAVIDTDGIIAAVERHRLHGDAARRAGHGGRGAGQGHARRSSA